TKLGAAAFPGQGGAGIEGANVTIVNAGSITGGASTNGVLPQAAAILFTGGVNSLEIQAGSNISGNVVAFSAADTLKLGGSTDSNFNVSQIGPTAQYQGFGIYEKTGTSDWTLSGTTTAVTPWTLTQGFLTIDNDAELGAASGGLTFNGGTLEASANITSARAVTLAAGGGTLFADTGATLTLTNTVTGAGALIKDGGGAVTLEGVNTYTGLTTISAGTLGLSGAGSISDSSGVVDNGRFDISAAGASITTLSGQGVVNLASQTLALTNASGAFTGPILGGGALMVTAGAETLSGASPLTGNLTLQGTSALTLSGAPAVVSAGTIQVGATAGAGPATLTIEDGAHLDVTAPMTTSNIGAAVGSTGALVVTGAGSNLQVQDLLTVGGVSTSTGGSLTIADGATASIGILQTGILAARNAIPPTVVVTGAGSSLNAVTRIQFFGGNLSVLDGGQVTTPTLAFGANQTSNLLISGAGSSVTSSVTFGAGSTNTVTLADGGVLHSATSIPLSSGSLVINVGGAVGQAATGAGVLNVTALALGATASQVNFNHTDADYVFATVVGSQGAAEINQVAGVTHLTGASTGFGGVATVSGGALLVDGTLGSATSSVAVNGGQLGGVGTIGGNVTVNGGALAPGDSLPGTLTINGNLVLGSAANLQMQLGQAGAAGGALNSLVVVNGNLTLGGTLNVTQSAGGTFGDGVYRLIDYSGTLTDNTLAIGSLPLGTGTVQTSIANQVNLVVSGGPTLTFWNGGGQPNA
ncbi:MAG: autotransporter-associated beta strand repeat-containing protein, partial [Caulobacteraceae bacterium]